MSGCQTSCDERSRNTLNYILIISPAPRTSLHSIHCEIAICVVTRFVELGQLGCFSFAQIPVLYTAINQTSKTIVQQAAFVASALGCCAHGSSLNDLLDKKTFFV